MILPGQGYAVSGLHPFFIRALADTGSGIGAPGRVRTGQGQSAQRGSPRRPARLPRAVPSDAFAQGPSANNSRRRVGHPAHEADGRDAGRLAGELHRLGPVAARTLIAYVGEIERQVKESQTSQAADFFLVGPPRRAASASVSHTPSPLQLTAQPAVLPRRSAPTSSSSRSTSADSPHRTASTHTAASSALRQSSTPTTLRRRGSSQTSGAHRSWSTPGCQ